jgi:hypothetical protein
VLGIFFSTIASRPALGPAQPPIQWVPRALSLGVKQLEREADHSPPSSAEVKDVWSYISTSPIRLHCSVLKVVVVVVIIIVVVVIIIIIIIIIIIVS